MISIISFLLCFACEEVCFWIFDSLLNELFSQEFFLEETDLFEQEITVVHNLGKVFKIFSEENEELIKTFLKDHIKICFNTCFFNIFNFQIVYFIWDNMFAKGSVQFPKLFSTFFVILHNFFQLLILYTLVHNY